ncbi:MAG: UDP-N-acetylmuramoyl-tripeptide--D-alanyl-D-alanine ligase [Abditibacteriaceae bacterium]
MNAAPDSNNAIFTLKEIFACSNASLLFDTKKDIARVSIEGVFTDTKKISLGAAFIALTGERFDGHNFLQQAADAGAIAAIVEKDIDRNNSPKGLILLRVKSTLEALGDLARCHREKFSLEIIGITGSYGKTTTRAMIAAALGAQLKVLSTQENFNNEIGVAQTLLQLDSSQQAAVIEMGMRGKGQIEYLTKMARPTIGVITNIGPQHIELLGSVENIASAKAELIRELAKEGTVILPADDAMFDYLKDQTPARIVSFGQSAGAQYRVHESTFDAHGSSVCQIETPNSGMLELQLSLPGIHNAINAAAALATADVCGVDLRLAIQSLQNLQIPGARMQLHHTNNAIVIDDCYNAGPSSMRASLEVLREFPDAKRRVAILGSMLELGDWSEKEHRAIGEQASEIAQLIIGVGEDTKVLLEAAQNTETQWFENAAEAAEWIPARIQNGDVILVKGSRSIGLEKVVEALNA